MNRKQKSETEVAHVNHDRKQKETQPPTYGTDLWPWPTLTLDRWPSSYRIYESDIHYSPGSEPPEEGHQTEDPYQAVGAKETCDGSTAWRLLVWSDTSDETVSIMLSPGDRPAVFRGAYFHPRLYSVWRIDSDGLAVLVGYYPAEKAKQHAKRLDDRGEQFAIATGYLWNEGGWNDDPTETSVVERFSTEGAGTEGAGTDGLSTDGTSDDLNHLLTLARAGRNSQESSRCERQARRIIECVLKNAIGLDTSATAGIADLIEVVQTNPMSGVESVREAIQ